MWCGAGLRYTVLTCCCVLSLHVINLSFLVEEGRSERVSYCGLKMNIFSELVLAILTCFSVIKLPIHAFRVFDSKGVVTILALNNEPISIQCEQDTPMTYCGFQHPSGKRFSFSGNELNDGHCAIRINATLQDTGEWRCHIGKKTIGVEMIQKIQLRVVDKVAALEQNLSAVHGKDVTIECATTQGFLPLSYCRFEPPNAMPFSIDSAVNKSHPILGRYYFPPNKSLDRGDCAVIIRKIKYEDVGLWTCGAGMSDGKEYTDSVKIVVQGIYTMSTASATGVTFGALGIGGLLILLAYFGWKKRRFLEAGAREPAVNEGHELGEIGVPGDVPRTSQSRRASASSRSPPGSRRSPLTSRVPTLIIQSPSEPGSSPLMS